MNVDKRKPGFVASVPAPVGEIVFHKSFDNSHIAPKTATVKITIMD